ncbi:hypothetical protein ACHAXS_005837 [Conticribra weissflogii]
MAKRRHRKRNRPSPNPNDDPSTLPSSSPTAAAVPPITHDGEMPQKRFYRSRAHCNPLSFNEAFDYPVRPDLFDWTEEHYPNHPKLTCRSDGGLNGNDDDDDDDATDFQGPRRDIHPTVLDVGCGFGGLTLALSTLLPDDTILGLEIRSKVAEYVRLRILAKRKEAMGKDEGAASAAGEGDVDTAQNVGNDNTREDVHDDAAADDHPSNEPNDDRHHHSRTPRTPPNAYQNASVLRTNAMKYLPNHIPPRSLSKLFFCFPDPHFKRKNHPRRIVSARLLAEYAHLLLPGEGKLYCITDVRDLHDWHAEKCGEHPLFEEVTGEELEGDECVRAMRTETEEGKKVRREGREMWWKVYRRVGAERERELEVGAEGFFGRGEFGVSVVEEGNEEERE